ncbi:iron-sulfur cluster assembly protein, partial [Staphylococcus aureus]|nr:iron-sulfur cluster assembly protein [Staphylococcus aureus]
MSTENPVVKAIADALSHVNDPEIKRPITDLNMIDEITVDEQGRAFVRILLTVAGCPLKTELREQATEAVRSVDGVTSVSVELGTMTDEQRDALKVQLRGDVPERVIPFAQ